MRRSFLTTSLDYCLLGTALSGSTAFTMFIKILIINSSQVIRSERFFMVKKFIMNRKKFYFVVASLKCSVTKFCEGCRINAGSILHQQSYAGTVHAFRLVRLHRNVFYIKLKQVFFF